MKNNVMILIQTDNVTAMSYINKRGGTSSLSLMDLAKEIRKWCMEREISLKAEQVPRILNTIADRKSRIMWDWKLNPVIFSQINTLLGPLELDLFASRMSAQLP